MRKLSILITNPIHKDAVTLLRRDFNVVEKNGVSEQELIDVISLYDALITRSDTGVTRAVIEAGKKLRVIGRAGIGIDNIDADYAKKKSVSIVNAPLGNAKAAAEHAIGLMFALARNILLADQDLRNGIWGKQKYIGYQLVGKTVGIIGFGNVGREVGRIAKGIGMNIIVYDPFIEKQKNIRFVAFDTLLKLSDFVTLHTPLTQLTERMIGKDELALMKPTTFLINCARGKVIDESELLIALKKRQIAGAALDVFSKEPLPKNHPFFTLYNVILTPHLGGSTYEAKRATGFEIAEKMRQIFFDGKATSQLPLRPWNGFDRVIFDCDSTLCAIEGIDELARIRGVARAVTQLTKKAMNGKLSFDSVFEKRLALIKPHKADFQHVAKMYIDSLVPDAKRTIDILKKMGKRIILISGGYCQALHPLASYLGIDQKNVFANTLRFDVHGIYKGFDRDNPLWQQNGKEILLRKISDGKKTLFVGDGAIDLNAKHIVDLFVGFGGIQRRAYVRRHSDVYIQKPVLSPIIPLMAGTQIRKVLNQKIVKQGIDYFLNPKVVSGGEEYKKVIRRYLKE